MKTTQILIVLAGFLFSVEAKSQKVPFKSTTITSKVCKTHYTTHSTNHVKTQTHTKKTTLHPIAVVTSFPVKTITAKAHTKTVTKSATIRITEPVKTETFRVTPTVTKIATKIDTFTSTALATVTITETSEPATVISAPSGWVFPNATPKPSTGKSRIRAAERDVEEPRSEEPRSKKGGFPFPNNSRCKRQVKKYPDSVVCSKRVEVIHPKTVTVRSWKTKTVTKPGKTKTITRTSIHTKTIDAPDAIKTITVSAKTITNSVASTVTTTVTQGVTVTQSNTLPSATTYEVCGPKNVISKDSAGVSLSLYTPLSSSSVTLDTDTPEDCCLACIAESNCLGSNYLPSLEGTGQSCQLLLGDTCPAGQTQVGETYVGYDSGYDLFISNGPCGRYQYVDDVGAPLN
ncbi:MAG: hypothetical protein M4579_005857 [Chaenotheca gracillima]|nr:MAG: hypothetical protein M4579_005857 [Chaenotheca gracillima]